MTRKIIAPLCQEVASAQKAEGEGGKGFGFVTCAVFSPFYCDKNPDGERPAFWKTGFSAY